MKKLQILDRQGIAFRMTRMAYQIWEKFSQEEEVILVGVEETGLILAYNLQKELELISPLKVKVFPLKMDKKNPLAYAPQLQDFKREQQNIVLIDDVANSGKTLAFAMMAILNEVPKHFAIAVLVDRKHKNFPIQPDIIGLSLSTTLQEHITVVEVDGQLMEAYIN